VQVQLLRSLPQDDGNDPQACQSEQLRD
jgi:hypothetical protein